MLEVKSPPPGGVSSRISSLELGRRLAEARSRARLTQAEVAEALAIPLDRMEAIEKGEQPASNQELVKFAFVAGTGVHYLLRETAICEVAASSLADDDAEHSRRVDLLVSAYDEELLSEMEFAEALGTDIVSARDVYQSHIAQRVAKGPCNR